MWALLFYAPLSAIAIPLQAGDTVAVVGASGNVGRLVALRLGDSFQVRAVSRDPERIRSYFSGKPSIELFQSELKGEGAGAGLRTALEGAHGLVICTGTTAFPTRAWSPDGKRDVTMPVLRALVEARLDLRKAVAALDAQGFNTPRQIDALANLAVLDAWRAAAGDRRKRCVFMSSIGVQRRQQMPFPVLNACGVLDAKAEAEAALKADAAASGYDACIVRPGQLFGGPYDNNYYLGTLFQLDKDANTRGVAMARGDTLIGDTLRSTLAEVLAQLVAAPRAPADVALVNEAGEPPSVEQLQAQLAALA